MFYEQVFDSFKEINKKIDANHKDTSEKIDDLCTRLTAVTAEFKTHVAVNEAIGENEVKKVDNKDRKFYIVIGLVGAITSAVGIIF